MVELVAQVGKEYDIIIESARAFAQGYLLPTVIERDNAQRFPTDEVKKMGELGFMGMMVPQAYGGGGMDTVAYVLVMQEIAKIDASASVCMSVNNSLVCWGLNEYGTEEQKQRYLVPLAQGDKLGAFCLSEPSCGSDATSQQTTAIRQGDHYVLNGTKNWITNGNSADIHLVIAQSDVSRGAKGINAFIVERGWKGVQIGKKEDKMGIRSSDTHSITFDNVCVPTENRLGKEGDGFVFAMRTLDGGRIGIAAQANGIAQGAYNCALRYAQERQSFNKPIGQHQAIANKLADMVTRIQASQGLTLHAARCKDRLKPYSTPSAVAKLYASTCAMDVTTEAVQVHGGYGYVKEFHVERMMRDAKITQIYEGTSEIQKLVISRSILS